MALYRNHDEERQARIDKLLGDQRPASDDTRKPTARPKKHAKATLHGKRPTVTPARQRAKR